MDIQNFTIQENESLLEAMTLLDAVAKKILFVTKEGKLQAAITDGDIRRWILKKGSLEATVKEIANYKPHFLYKGDESLAKAFMKRNSLEALPIINSEKEIVSIIFYNDEVIVKYKTLEVPVVMMAGGQGTRLYPYTKILPKPLIPIGEKPISEHIIEGFVKQGCTDFYLILNHKKNMIKAYFNEVKKDYQITYVDEEKPLGTGGGLSLLKNKIHSTFILTNSDILVREDFEKIVKFHKAEKNLVTIISSLKKISIPYGVIDIGVNGEMSEMREKPDLSFIINTGLYVVEPEIIGFLSDNEQVDFPDIIEKCKTAGKRIGVYPISENNWMDMGQFADMEEMKNKLEIEKG